MPGEIAQLETQPGCGRASNYIFPPRPIAWGQEKQRKQKCSKNPREILTGRIAPFPAGSLPAFPHPAAPPELGRAGLPHSRAWIS